MESIQDYEAGLAVVMSGYSEAAWDELRAAKVWPPGTEHMKCYRNFSIKELKDKVLKFYRAKALVSDVPIVKLAPLNNPLAQCSNLKTSTGACPLDRLVDMDHTIREAMEVVQRGAAAEGTESGAVRPAPLVYARLSRGGKTTFLIRLFEALKESYFPVLISFSGFERGQDTQLQALVRMISLQLTDIDVADSLSYTFDQTRLLQIIREASQLKPVVLLIDELNILSNGKPLEENAAKFLVSNFLDPKNCFLVYTSHIALDLDSLKLSTRDATSPGVPQYQQSYSPRGYATVHQPQCLDCQQLRAIAPECAALTPAEVVLYGGIPSLIYNERCINVNGVMTQMNARARFSAQKIVIADTEADNVLKHFVTEVLRGDQRCKVVRRFDLFSSVPNYGKRWWPICFVRYILKLFPQIDHIPFEQIWARHLEGPVAHDDAGAACWELIVQSAIMLQCIDADCNAYSTGPFDILDRSGATATSLPGHILPEVDVYELPAYITTLDAARLQIQQYAAEVTVPTLMLVTPTYARFPDYDGFVVYCHSATDKPCVVGYQCRLDRTYPKRDAPTEWIDRSLLLRGAVSAAAAVPTVPAGAAGADHAFTAASNPAASGLRRGWEHLDQRKMLAFLGYSLAPLYPVTWPAVPTVDSFD